MKEKVTVISASNREENRTSIFAEFYLETLEEMGFQAELFSLEDFPDELTLSQIYDFDKSPVGAIVNNYLMGVNRLIFVVPEYNGSFPGILKLFIDAVHPSHFHGKRAALTGISAGRSGNVRGMDHLTNILNYLKVEVHSNKLPISVIEELLSDGKLVHEVTKSLIRQQIEGFIKR